MERTMYMQIPGISGYVTLAGVEYAIFGARSILGVGLYFKNADDNDSDRQEVITQLMPGACLTMIREPGNKFDPNAIALISPALADLNPRRVGYVPAEVARALAPLMDVNPDWAPSAWITEMAEGRNGTWFKFKVISERGQAERLVNANLTV